MKKLIPNNSILLVSSLCFLLTSCGFSTEKCYTSVKEKYPEAEIIIIPGEDYRFLVRKKNGDILFLKTMSTFNTKITSEFIAFKNN